MRLVGEEYSERLRLFSSFTLVLISGIGAISREVSDKMLDITTNSELSEEQVIEKLLELKSIHSRLKAVTYADALKIVCGALEDGLFYSLLDILDDNVELFYEDSEKRACGIRDVIEGLVCERLDHLYPSDEKTITCDIATVVEGERYGIGGKCILLTYNLENQKKQFYVIKPRLNNYQIDRIEFLRAQFPLTLEIDES